MTCGHRLHDDKPPCGMEMEPTPGGLWLCPKCDRQPGYRRPDSKESR